VGDFIVSDNGLIVLKNPNMLIKYFSFYKFVLKKSTEKKTKYFYMQTHYENFIP